MKFKCTYPKISGGFNAIIELDGKLLASDKFKDLSTAKLWTDIYCEGFIKGYNNQIKKPFKTKCKKCGKLKDSSQFDKETLGYGRYTDCQTCRNKQDKLNVATRKKQQVEWTKKYGKIKHIILPPINADDLNKQEVNQKWEV
jgi:hypothetical protein